MPTDEPEIRVVSQAAHYGRVPESLLLDPSVSDGACRFYAYLTRWDYRQTGQAFPGEERAAADLGWSVRTVRRHVAALEAVGAIIRKQGGAGRPLTIHLLADVVTARTDLAELEEPARTLLSDSPAKSVNRTYIEREIEREVSAQAPRNPRRGRRCPDPFDVTDPMIAWVRSKFPTLDWETETDKFCDHWAAAAGPNAVKLDWEAAWRNWMRQGAQITHLRDYSRRPTQQRG